MRFSLHLRGHIQQRFEKLGVELLVPQIKEELVEVLQLVPQERFQELFVEQVVAYFAFGQGKNRNRWWSSCSDHLLVVVSVFKKQVSLSSPWFLVDLSTGLHAFVLLRPVVLFPDRTACNRASPSCWVVSSWHAQHQTFHHNNLNLT